MSRAMLGIAQSVVKHMLGAKGFTEGRLENKSYLMSMVDIPTTKTAMTLKALHRAKEAGVLVSKLEKEANSGRASFRWGLNPKNIEYFESLGIHAIESRFAELDKLLVEEFGKPAPEPRETRKKRRETEDTEELPLIDGANANRIQELESEVENLRKKLEERQETTGILRVQVGDLPQVSLSETVPPTFSTVLELASAGRNILLVGPAGCGKTTIASMVAKAMHLDFSMLSASGGTNESQLLGRCIPNLQTGVASYTPSPFVNAYRYGGVFLLDEIDAAAADLLLCMNSALANGYITTPDGSMVKKHDAFIMIAAANTFGRGATRMYSGRTQLDEATLDRFRIGTVEVDYSEEVERALCPDLHLLARLHEIRKRVEIAGIRRIVSTRFIKDAYIMRKQAGWSVDKIVNVLTSGWSTDEKAKGARHA